jgi:hypothetical protein
MEDKIQEYIDNLELKKNENGLFECPFCSYTARSKKMMQNHLKGHDKEILKELNKKEQKKEPTQTAKKPRNPFRDPEITKCNGKRCKIKLIDGTLIIGDVVSTYKFMIQLNNAKIQENGDETTVNILYVHKGNIIYITPLKE